MSCMQTYNELFLTEELEVTESIERLLEVEYPTLEGKGTEGTAGAWAPTLSHCL